MRDYLLFIDTEASGLPRNWEVGYGVKGNWPHTVQVSWIIYTKDRQQVKKVNYYINDNDFKTKRGALKVHGITEDYRAVNGVGRSKALAELAYDISTYMPLVVGHFIELDFNVLGADYYRIGIDNPIKLCPTFCTMKATQHLVRNPNSNFLRLGELYNMLFNKKLGEQHNSMEDARATAECFFELLRKGDLKEEKVVLYQKVLSEPTGKGGCLFPALLILIFSFLIFMI